MRWWVPDSRFASAAPRFGHSTALAERPLMAGKRPLTGQPLSDFGLLGHLERVIYLNT